MRCWWHRWLYLTDFRIPIHYLETYAVKATIHYGTPLLFVHCLYSKILRFYRLLVIYRQSLFQRSASHTSHFSLYKLYCLSYDALLAFVLFLFVHHVTWRRFQLVLRFVRYRILAELGFVCFRRCTVSRVTRCGRVRVCLFPILYYLQKVTLLASLSSLKLFLHSLDMFADGRVTLQLVFEKVSNDALYLSFSFTSVFFLCSVSFCNSSLSICLLSFNVIDVVE